MFIDKIMIIMRKILSLVVAALCCATMFATEGALPGKFTINAQGDQVVFSQGNLQYQASTQTWKFANNQWDYVGAGNANISDTYDGWIDLFGWGTGNNPTKHSTNYADYSTFTDWGVNPISNGGDETNQWRTLTEEESEYLFFGRKQGRATVNGVHGVIFLPDVWTLPAGLNFTINTNNWTTNLYSVSEWQQMEAAGAIFLPCAGKRSGSSVSLLEEEATYWSSMHVEDIGYAVYYSINSLGIIAEDLYQGLSVRLVQAAPACDIEPTDIYETACDKFVWEGSTYTASQDITKTFKAVNGCDSVVTLHLTINYSSTGSETQTAVGSYEWHETTYTESGEYQYTLTNAAGCDSVATLVLTIIPTWKVTVVQPEVGGEISLSEVNNDINLDAVPDGTELHFLATPEEGYRFDSWIGCEYGELIVTEDASISCVFVPDDQAIDAVSASEQKSARKHLQEGIFLIEKNGKLYNATGSEVK